MAYFYKFDLILSNGELGIASSCSHKCVTFSIQSGSWGYKYKILLSPFKSYQVINLGLKAGMQLRNRGGVWEEAKMDKNQRCGWEPGVEVGIGYRIRYLFEHYLVI